MRSKSKKKIFHQKLFGMNTNPPAQVSTLDHALWELAIKIKPDEETIKEHRRYAQRVNSFRFTIPLIFF